MAVRTSDTREEILKLGTHLIQLYGYNAFSYADISKELGIKNAAVHYHYPGKEDLLAAIIDQYILKYEELDKKLSAPGISSKQKIEAFINRYSDLCEQNKICIIGSVCSDFNTMPDAVKSKLTNLIEMVLGMVEKVLQQGRKNGDFSFPETARAKALLIMTNLAAGVQLSRITGQKDYRTICKSILSQIAP
jgi:TetR/AcrR family transcriptional regulator, transcriptional repressor for nem operon